MTVLVGTWAPVGTEVRMVDGQRAYLPHHKIESRVYKPGFVPLTIDHRGQAVGWLIGVAVVEGQIRFIAHTDRTDLGGWGCSPTWGKHFGDTAFLEVTATRRPNVEGAVWRAGDGDLEQAASVAASLITMDRREREAQVRAARQMGVARGHEHFLDPEVREAMTRPVRRWGSPGLVTR